MSSESDLRDYVRAREGKQRPTCPTAKFGRPHQWTTGAFYWPLGAPDAQLYEGDEFVMCGLCGQIEEDRPRVNAPVQSPWVPTTGTREDAFEAGWWDAHDQFCEYGGGCLDHAYTRQHNYPAAEPYERYVRCQPDCRHEGRCGQDEIGDWWHPAENQSFRPERGAE